MSEETGLTVRSSYILGHNMLADYAIYQKAKDSGNIIIISKDADFHELISRLGSPPKLISIRRGNSDNKTLWAYLKPNIDQALDILISSDVDIVEFD